MQAFRPGNAHRHYRDLALRGKLEAANPHGLVALCYDQLVQDLEVVHRVAASGSSVAALPQAARARSILLALEAGLDLNAGGELADMLGGVFRAMRTALKDAASGTDPARFRPLVEGAASLAQSWAQIDPAQRTAA